MLKEHALDDRGTYLEDTYNGDNRDRRSLESVSWKFSLWDSHKEKIFWQSFNDCLVGGDGMR